MATASDPRGVVVQTVGKRSAAAQIELIRGPIEITNEKGEVEMVDASAPYYWAAFQLYGDWQ